MDGRSSFPVVVVSVIGQSMITIQYCTNGVDYLTWGSVCNKVLSNKRVPVAKAIVIEEQFGTVHDIFQPAFIQCGSFLTECLKNACRVSFTEMVLNDDVFAPRCQ